jgi:hypothetical protein
VQNALDNKVAQLRHQNMGLGKLSDGEGQRPNMVMMAMGQSNGVQLLPLNQFIEGQAIQTLALGVSTGVQQ